MDEGATHVAAADGGAHVEVADVRFVDVLGTELPRLQRIARMLTGSADAADDLVAEAVARTLPKWRSGSVDDAPAYLRRVVVNLASRRFRRMTLALRRDRSSLDWLRHPYDVAEVAAERDRTLRAVMGLPVRRRAVVVLRFYDDLPLERIARLLGISEGTVKSQLSRALEQLRAELGDLEEI